MDLNQQKDLAIPIAEMLGNASSPRTKVARYHSLPERTSQCTSRPTDCRPVGLQNLGSTCWFNVAVQLLYHIPAFKQAVLEYKIPPQCSGRSVEVISGLQELFLSIMYSERKLIDPTRAVNSIGKLLGEGQGQQDASEFLGVVLNRIREANAEIIEKLFIGTCLSSNSMGSAKVEEFMQYNLQVSEDTTLLALLESSLKANTLTSKNKSGQENLLPNFLPENSRQSFSKIPQVLLVDLCRLVSGRAPAELVKVNHTLSFPSLFFMDRFQHENHEQVNKLNNALGGLLAAREEIETRFKSLAILLQNVPQLQKIYQSYQHTVVFNTNVDFSTLQSLNLTWEKEIQVKMNELHQQSKQLEKQLEHIHARELPTCRPYQLHAAIVHQGQSNGGHYWIYVWDSVQHIWYRIDDNSSQQVTWDTVVQASVGGIQQDDSAHCLVYLDALQTNSLLDTKADYEIGPADLLRYLKDNTDVRTRHAAYGKSQTCAAVLAANATNEHPVDPSTHLFRALDSERQRLYSVCQQWMGQSVGDEARLLHFGVYLLANQVEFEPFVYWTLLQHFSSYTQLVEEGTSQVCIAARHALAFMESSTTQEQKKVFIQWNTAYYQFRLIIRHVMNGITHVFSQNFSAAVPLAVKALYLHHGLSNNSLKGPAMSVNPRVVHSLIEKAVTSLSDELLENDLEAVGELACAVLFDAIINWCEYADANNLEAARRCSRRIADQWMQQVKTYTSLAECASATGLRTLAEVERKLQRVDSVLNQPDGSESTPFDFKGHIPESPEEGDKLALKWKQMWLICAEQHILSP